MNPTQPSPQPAIHNPLSVMQEGETVICEIRRHPIGLIMTYIGTGLAIVLLFAAFLFGMRYLNYNTSANMRIGSLIVGFVTLLMIGYLLIITKVYNGNRWVLTSDSLTQIQQTSLFSSQASQLSLANLEDITAEQNGILTHLFNFGLLRAETAGERSKFVFMYCPDPNTYAQQILNARERYEQIRIEAGAPATAATS